MITIKSEDIGCVYCAGPVDENNLYVLKKTLEGNKYIYCHWCVGLSIHFTKYTGSYDLVNLFNLRRVGLATS